MLDGASRIPKMFARAKELGMPAVGLTDHGVMYGAIPFYLEGRATGIKPIIGVEAYVAPKSRFDRPAHRETAYHHLTMLSANPTGYRNLMQLSSLAFLEGYDSRSRRPRMDRELLAKYSDGVIVLSGCLSGELQKKLAFPFVTVVMTLLAIPFGMTTGKRGTLYGIGVGIVLALGYWVVGSAFAAIGKAGLLGPMMAGWAPNILAAGSAAYLLLTART